MQEFPSIIKGTHFHLVGIKGTGMAALAELLAAQGAVITGSDVSDVFYTDEIINRLGIKALPFSGANITDSIDCAVFSSAYSKKTNPDLIAAAKKSIPSFLYTEALGAISKKAYSVGICGVHGKTSTTGLLGTILSHLPMPSQALAGSIITSFGTAPVHSCVMTHKCASIAPQCTPLNGWGGKDADGEALSARPRYFVAETCEYERHFMSFHPQKIVLTSVESDHQDCYPSYNDILCAFTDYLCLLPDGGEVIYCADDKGASEAVKKASALRPGIVATPYGFTAKGDYRIKMCAIKDGAVHFDLDCMKDIALHIPGRHEVLDAAAAVAAARALLMADGRDPAGYESEIRAGAADFTGGKRRSEVTGHCSISGNDTIFIDDYGHHPTAIRTTLAGYREFYAGRRIVVDFMSHTYTRTQALLEEFAAAFDCADDVIINKIYASARENASASGVTGEILAERTKAHHNHVVYAAEFDEAAKISRAILSEPLPPQYPNGCLFVTMGAGDNWKVGQLVMRQN